MKTYCLDTSVFIDTPKVIDLLGESEIIVPFCVLAELDRNRKREGVVGKNARDAIRNIDKITKDGSWRGGAETESGGILRLISSDFDQPTNDLKIIACAEWVQTQEDVDVILLSNDIGLRVQAEAKRIKTEGFSRKTQDFVYTGVGNLTLDQYLINEIHEKGILELSNNDFTIGDYVFYPNQMFVITNFEEKSSTLVRVEVKKNSIVLNLVKKQRPWGVEAGSVEQSLAIDLLLNPEIDLVSLVGKAGCGKTFLASACGLEQLIEKRLYDQIIILRPIVPMGRDIGYLPGTMEEKLAPWIQPVKDNLLTLCKNNKKSVDMFFERNQIVIEAMSYIRGRSIPRSFIIVDECQNLSLEQLKTVLTRAGEGSKIVLTGDIEQIDNTSVDVYSNGLSRVVEAFKEEEIAGHITLVKGQRSKLATISAQIL